ncbi:restriction endonuclease subunit S domain-containing protein [Streptomyces europaeiscabiei]|uniref:hypothetical protein n=1 Tax=Streptomyces europaeiscabiei TaxID=146819 RepID=UPI0029ACEEC1|nr:hypothetical protein [Streptomyces europaeiscabiei]MDX3866818.1 hypothetical protein [Streptomyces europaeiscabiei]MDX3873153.1 hypothetical protein [Streptomyces europaeiscabiei]
MNPAQIGIRYVLRPREVTDCAHLQVLSVYRDYGVIPKNSRDDNNNKTPLDLSRYQEVRPGDLVINKMKAWQGSLGVSRYHGIVSPDYLVCSIDRSVHPEFLHHLLRSAFLISEFGRRSKGIRPAQWRLYWEDLAEISVPLPPVHEQRRIAEFLDAETARIDRLVSAREKQLGVLGERYATGVSEMVTPGISRGGKRSQLWPWLPLAVSTARLGYFARVQTGVTVHGAREGTDEDVEHPYLRVANVQGERIDLDEVKTIVIPASMARRSTLRDGDVVMTEANGNPDNLGRGAVWRGEISGMIHQNHVFAIRASRHKLLPEYLTALLASNHGRYYFRFTSTQVGIATTSASKVLDFPIPIASLERQEAIVRDYVAMRDSAGRAKEVLERQLALLAERRQAVISAAVTGRLDVVTARPTHDRDL